LKNWKDQGLTARSHYDVSWIREKL
jgi:hypothetical protein